MNYLDRNEYNFEPSPEVIQAYKDFNPKELGFYTRIYDQGKKSILSVFLSERYGIDESQILLGYGGEYILKQMAHYYLTLPDGNNRTTNLLQPRSEVKLSNTPFMKTEILTATTSMICKEP